MSDGGYIFVSYAHSDRDYVHRLVGSLARSGVDVWADDEIPTGERWEQVLRERVTSCSALLVVMSPAAAVSRWVAREVDLAQRAGKPVLPLRLRGDIILGLDEIQVEDVRDGRMPGAAFVQRLRGQAPLRRMVRHAVGPVPNGAACFQQRTVAADLDAALAARGTAILTGSSAQILSGLGGVGKTQLAAAVARRLRDNAQLDILVWINAQSRSAIVTGYAQIGAEITGVDQADPAYGAAAFLAYLGVATARWLVVLDDLADPSDLDGWWPPATQGGQVIVTTRRRDASLRSHGVVLPVGLFTPWEARAYLAEQFAEDPARLDEADDLAADLGYLPLALAQAVAYIFDGDLTCAEYRVRFSDQHNAFAALVSASLPDDYSRPSAIALTLSVEAADQLAPRGLARPLSVLLSLLNPNGVPIELMSARATVDFLTAVQPNASTAEPVTAGVTRDAIACLVRLNLVVLDEDATGNTRSVRVHALVQRSMRDQTSPDLLARAARAAADGIVEIWPEIDRDVALAQSLRSNVDALRSHAEGSLWTTEAHTVLVQAGYSLGSAGLLQAATAYFDQLTTDASWRLGAGHRDTLLSRAYSVRWRGESGDAAGAAADAEVLVADLVGSLGPDDPDVLAARSNLARWRGEAGDLRGAIEANRALLADQVRILGADHGETLSTRNNIAHSRARAGDPAGAVAEFEALVDDYSRVLGPQSYRTLTIRGSLARWRGVAGDVPGAVAAYRTLVPDQIAVLGPDHPITMRSRSNLASMIGEGGDVAGAVLGFEELLDDQLRILGSDHPDTLATRGNLASWRGEAGDVGKAVNEFEALAADFARVMGVDHPQTLTGRGNLAYWRQRAGDLSGAAVAFARLLSDRVRVLGADHPDTLWNRANLATLLGDAGDPGAAVQAFQEVLSDRIRVLGADHPETLSTRSSLAFWRAESGDPASAVAEFEAVLGDLVRVCGPDHPATHEAQNRLVLCRQQLDR